MTGLFGRAAHGLLLLLGVGLIATPWIMGFYGDIAPQWAAWAAGGAVAAAALASLDGGPRDGALWTVLAGAGAVAAQLVPGTAAHEGLAAAFTAVGAYAVVLGLVARFGRPSAGEAAA